MTFHRNKLDSVVLDYYNRRFGENLDAAFIHLIREIGEIALAMEKNNLNHLRLKITEASALLKYLASRYDLDVEANIQFLYSEKLNKASTN
jgi:NTP pyrophosphatase (non-canonical NTP hydrolase)